MLAGLRFDLSVLAYANGVFILFCLLPLPFSHKKFYQIFLFILWIVPNTLALIPNIIDSVYFPFVFKRSTWDLLGIVISMKSEMGNLWISFLMDFWYTFIIFGLLVFGFVMMWRKICKQRQFTYTGLKTYCIGIVFWMVMLTFTVVGMRGGLQKKPINLATASLYAPPEHTPLVLNSTFSLIRTMGRIGLDEKNWFETDEQMNQWFRLQHDYSNPQQAFDQKNIVIIVLESFSTEHLNSRNPYKPIKENVSFTPFLDSLTHEGYYCSRAYANGKRSIEGIPAIFSSIPVMMRTPFIQSQYINNSFYSLPTLLKEKSYSSAFFHGGMNGTMNFDLYSKIAGFDSYYGLDEYDQQDDYDGKWGIWDEPFLKFVTKQLDQMQQPFFAGIFTLSSHHPYKIPPEYQNTLPEGPLPIHKAIAYADLSLRNFFETAAQTDWYNHTVFVICADHTAEPFIDEYSSSTEMFSIPLLFYIPNSDFVGTYSEVCQQTDIFPSVLDLLNFDIPFNAFGRSVFDTTSIPFHISFLNETYQLIGDSIVISIRDDEITQVWNLNTTLFPSSNNASFEPEKEKLFMIYKAFLQQFNNNMIHNTLIIK